jgi:hypothetical protein
MVPISCLSYLTGIPLNVYLYTNEIKLCNKDIKLGQAGFNVHYVQNTNSIGKQKNCNVVRSLPIKFCGAKKRFVGKILLVYWLLQT